MALRAGLVVGWGVVALAACSSTGPSSIAESAKGSTRAPDAPVAAAAADDARASALLAKALAGFGGASVVDGVQTLHVAGTMERSLPAGTLAGPVAWTYAFPDRMRRDVGLPDGTTISTLVTPSGAILAGPFPASPLPPGPGGAMVMIAGSHPLVLLRTRGESGLQVRAPGVLTRGVQRYEVLEGRVKDVRIDLLLGDDGRVAEMVVHVLAADGALPRPASARYSDFRASGGLVLPHRYEGTDPEGVRFVVRIESVQVNPPLPPAAFDVPKDAK